MGEQRTPSTPVVAPVTNTDMLLAQLVSLAGEIRDCLSGQVPPPGVNLADLDGVTNVADVPKKKPARKPPAKKVTGQ